MANTTQTKMFSSAKDTASQQPVECLGIKFPNDEARRQYFLEKLREKLNDPNFRKVEGFPVGEDEDILALSDPPYYTACPNPFIEDFILSIDQQRKTASPEKYHREPFASDVSEGKNDPIYTLHSYHTKVPHRAVMRYILHYTSPGDVVFDGFCGTGMTGVAAQLCGDASTINSLGYTVKPNGSILDEQGRVISDFGRRNVILSDLSPLASSIAAAYNNFSSVQHHVKSLGKLVNGFHDDYAHVYATKPQPSTTVEADYYVWSEHFSCPHCSLEQTLFAFAVEKDSKTLSSSFHCPKCKSELSKDDLVRTWTDVLDIDGRTHFKEAKTTIAEIVASVNKRTLRFPPSKHDLDLLRHFTAEDYAWYPTAEFPHGRQTRKVKTGSGISRVHQMFTPRELVVLSNLWDKLRQLPTHVERSSALFLFTACLTLLSRRERYRDGTGKGAQSGTLYVPSLQIEKNAFDVLNRKLEAFSKVTLETSSANAFVSCQSHTDLPVIPANSVDFIFTDPPFGESLQYGELNFFHEAWLRVFSNLPNDCVLNYVHGKGMPFYQRTMVKAFSEAFRILKSGRWISVEFHNSQNNIWMAIQQALWQAGFAVADVRILDKQQSGFNVVNRAGAVDKDLVISAYKPTSELAQQFEILGGTEKGMWLFVDNHLYQLPVCVVKGDVIETVTERQKHILFDRMVAFHVQKGVSVPCSATEFYAGLKQRFPERDEMFFLPSQVTDYDQATQEVHTVEQLPLFVSDEKSAIQWVRQQLQKKTATYRELTPQYMKETQKVWEKHEQPIELQSILDENFVIDSSDHWHVPDSKNEEHLAQLRHRRLVKEFRNYSEAKGKLKQVRSEALRAGFKECWQQRDYVTIVAMAKRLPEAVVQEDQDLLMYYDNALMRIGD